MSTDISTLERPASVKPRRRWLWLAAAPALAVLAAGGGLVIPTAHAQEADALDAGAAAEGPGGGFVARRLDRVLDKVGATAGQKAQIKAVWDGLRPQLKALRQQHGAIRKQIVAALTASTVDATAVEQLRQQSVSVGDKLSATFTQGLVQTAQILTADQRKQVQQELAQEHHRFHHRPGQ